MIFSDEVQSAGYPLPFLTLNTVGQTIMNFGSDAIRNEFLPRILGSTPGFGFLIPAGFRAEPIDPSRASRPSDSGFDSARVASEFDFGSAR